MSENDNLRNAEGKNEMLSSDAFSTETQNNLVETETNASGPSEISENEPNAISETTTDIHSEVEKSTAFDKEQKTSHVDEIEASNAEDAEDEGNAERHNVEEKEYDTLSMEALAAELKRLLSNHKVQTISKQVNEIKAEFNAKFHELLDEKKEEFINDGGNAIDFYYTNDTKTLFASLYKTYKQAINAYYKEREQNLQDNLNNRLRIIEDIKGLINVEENINTTYKHFKELQDQWRQAGPIPRDKYNNAWNSYHHHVERFYDFLHLNNDLRDMDFKHNYEQKLKIIERAEELAQDDNINRAFRELQVLHKLWKEDLGPVAAEHREIIWERFSAATKSIHDKLQDYYTDLDKSYEKNLEKKEDIISKIQAIAKDATNTHSAWQKKIKDIEALRTAFFDAGKVPIKVNETTWAKFKNAVKDFNLGKNGFYKDLKKDQFDNLKKKKDLIKIALDNKDNDDFETATPLMKKIQNEWQNIGHVPRRDSDKIWKQFKSACNHYFDRVHKERKAENQELFDAFEKKSQLLDELKTLEFSEDTKVSIANLQDAVKTWKNIGHVPQNKRYIDGKFYKAIDQKFDALKIDKTKLELIKFESKLENLANGEDTRLLDNEQNFIRKKIDDIKSEINQLENNLQFFSNVKSDNPLVKDVHKNIANRKEELKTWKSKLSKVRDMYS